MTMPNNVSTLKKVTSANFEALLLRSAREAAAIVEGTAEPAGAYTLDYTERDTEVLAPRHFSPAEVVSLRQRLRMSQGVLAGVVGVSVKTEQAWESGARTPTGAAARVLEILEYRPTTAKPLLKGVLSERSSTIKSVAKGSSYRNSARKAAAKKASGKIIMKRGSAYSTAD